MTNWQSHKVLQMSLEIGVLMLLFCEKQSVLKDS
jgi:hypothetical protein